MEEFGASDDQGAASAMRFVVQKHAARTMHFDFRLEKEGVLKSWAVPKGLPASVGVKHLAIEVEDHVLEFGRFEGEIPEGEYRAGTIEVWDSGTYELHKWSDDLIQVTLHGHRFEGPFDLVRFRKAGERKWLILRTLHCELSTAPNFRLETLNAMHST